MATYEIWLSTDTGTRLANISTAGGFSYTRVCNTIGSFTIVLPSDFDIGLIRVDRMIEIWRTVEGMSARLDFKGFVRRWQYQTDQLGRTTLIIGGPDMNDLLRRRIVYSYIWDYTDQADDLCKSMVDTQMVTATWTVRNWASVSVQADQADGPSTSIDASFRNVYTSLREIVSSARAAGTRVYFDMVPVTGTAYQFQTWINQRGTDHTTTTGASPVVFGLEFGNMESPILEHDYSTEINHVTSLGPGTDYYNYSDDPRVYASAWNRCEATVRANAGSYAMAAYAVLNANRPLKRFSANLRDNEGVKYGRDWSFGDAVTCTYLGQSFDGVVESLVVTVDGNGKETINARVDVTS